VAANYFGKAHPDHGRVAANFAEYLLHRGRAQAAVRVYEQSVAVLSQSLGAEHRTTEAVRLGLAKAYSELGRHSEAKALRNDTTKAGSRRALLAR
jgi:hypothetical protein